MDKYTNIRPLDEFNWEAYSGKEPLDETSKEEVSHKYGETLTTMKENDVVTGKITAMNKREAVVNIGFKSDGVIPMSELRYNPGLKVGDTIDVLIESREDRKGQLVLSHKRARAAQAWVRVTEALSNDEVVMGVVKSRTKGGMIVDVFGFEAFLPGSQIDVKPIHDYDIFVGKTMEFKIVKVNEEFKNVVVSHKALIEADMEQQRHEIISKLEKGQVLEGTVKNITTYGVFVDLGGVDGLIHITDLSWERVGNVEDFVKLDDKINVVILDFDEEKKRIALGLKQLAPHPWESLIPNMQEGDRIKGKVMLVTDYGAFVEIVPGVEGLVHISEMSWSHHLRKAQEMVKVGEEIEVVILSLNREERKIGLGMKQLHDPWESIEKTFPIGSRHTAKVRYLTNFGVFVDMGQDVEGIIHISDLSWTKRLRHPKEFTHPGAKIEVQVLEIDKENHRLHLGHKQVEENPWDVFESIFTVGSIHEGLILEITDKGATVSLPYGMVGFAYMSNLAKADGSQVAIDEKLPFKIIEFNKEMQSIYLSHRYTWDTESEKAKKQIRRTRKATPKTVTTTKASSASQSASDTKASAKPKRAPRKKKDSTDTPDKATLGDIDELSALKTKLSDDQTQE